MTRKELQSLIRKRWDELDKWYERDDPNPEQLLAKESDVIHEVANEMAQAGFPRLCAIGLHLRIDAYSESLKTYLSRCLKALQPKRRAGSKSAAADSDMLTPPQVARRYGVSPDTVRAWIASGELRAVNVGKGKRPRHRVHIDALKELVS